MTLRKNSKLFYLILVFFVFECKFFGPEWKAGPSEELFEDGIKYIRASSDVEDQFEKFKLDPRQIAKERMVPQIKKLKEGIEKKLPYKLVGLASPGLSDSFATGYSSSYAADQAWIKSFESGYGWCEFGAFFKTKIVSYEIVPSGVFQPYLKQDVPSGIFEISYDVYLREEGQTEKLTKDNAYLLYFKGDKGKKGEFGYFSITGFDKHCPIEE
ncbi:hypothetical protein JWG44_01645 [Leptospira sp. 201903071]|uniref:hypothetical protein n=1 Tax=Leptospira ainazelensis TaxID=2810034 RepID=UPI0019652EE4|nr:hypothetical protein [Leptospira ainazelensis]MBM9498956.1 hypothetical protein [Leptospira ainazelensis]